MKTNRKSRRLSRASRSLDSKVFNLDVEVWNEKTQTRSYRWEQMMNVQEGLSKFNADQLDSFLRLLGEVVEDEYKRGYRAGYLKKETEEVA